MSRYHVRVSFGGEVDVDPAALGLDTSRPLAAQLEGVTTADVLRMIDAYPHTTITVIEHISPEEGRMGRDLATKRGLGGWE